MLDDGRNCLPERPLLQQSNKVCQPVLEHPVESFGQHCNGGGGVSNSGLFLGSVALLPTAMPTAAPMFACLASNLAFVLEVVSLTCFKV